MHHEDKVRVFIMEAGCQKKEIRVEDEGTRELLGIKPNLHIRIHKK